MPVMIDFFLIRWRSSCAKQSGCRVIKPQLSMKQLYFHTSWCYNERKSIIFALSETLASFRLMTCFIHNETAINICLKKMSNLPAGVQFSHPGRKYFLQKSGPRVAKVCQSPEGCPPSGPWWKQLTGALLAIISRAHTFLKHTVGNV